MSKKTNKTAIAPIGTKNRMTIPITLMRQMPWEYQDRLSLKIQKNKKRIIIEKIEEVEEQ